MSQWRGPLLALGLIALLLGALELALRIAVRVPAAQDWPILGALGEPGNFGDSGSDAAYWEVRHWRAPRRDELGHPKHDTLLGWLRARPSSPKEAAAMKRARGRLLSYVGGKTSELHWQAIRALSVSVAGTVIFPMQDVLSLGSEARMNVPGSATGNWTWRVRGAELTQRLADRLSAITDVSGRSPQR